MREVSSIFVKDTLDEFVRLRPSLTSFPAAYIRAYKEAGTERWVCVNPEEVFYFKDVRYVWVKSIVDSTGGYIRIAYVTDEMVCPDEIEQRWKEEMI